MRSWSKLVACASVAGGLVLFATGMAAAVSGGGYNPDQQDCTWDATEHDAPNGYTQPGCHNFAVNVESGGTTDGNPNADNTRFVEYGNNQSPNEDGNPHFGALLELGDPGTYDAIHSGCVAANTDGTNGGTGTGCGSNADGTGFEANYDYYAAYCPVATVLPANNPSPLQPCASDQPIGDNSITPSTGTQSKLDTIASDGLLIYFGQDDNTDNGEHDGVSGKHGTDGAINGPSDGGGTMVAITPQSASETPHGTRPEGLFNASMGFCADGICMVGTTQEQTEYYGCGASNGYNDAEDVQCAEGTPESGRVYENNAPASTEEPDSCNGADDDSEACADGKPLNYYRAHTPSKMNAEPGVQLYQDPDPQRSPIFWVPGAYAGTCGIYFNDKGGENNPGTTGLGDGYIVDNTQAC